MSLKLTKRELEVMRYRLRGYSNEHTAVDLGTTKRTVDWHLANIYNKLGVNNLMDAVRMLWKSAQYRTMVEEGFEWPNQR